MTITQKELKQLLSYDEKSGEFHWKSRRSLRVRAGDLAGGIHAYGYREINIRGKKYKAHRLAWLYVYGYLPTKELDHIDGSRANNAIANLREADKSENQRNIGVLKRNKSGYKGVCFHKASRKWVAQARHKNQSHYLGLYDSPELAALAYKQFAEKNHGAFIRLG